MLIRPQLMILPRDYFLEQTEGISYLLFVAATSLDECVMVTEEGDMT